MCPDAREPGAGAELSQVRSCPPARKTCLVRGKIRQHLLISPGEETGPQKESARTQPPGQAGIDLTVRSGDPKHSGLHKADI